MSREIGPIGRRPVVSLCHRFAGVLLFLVAGLAVASALSTAQAQQTRVAKCKECAAEAAIVNALGARMPGLQRSLDETAKALQASSAEVDRKSVDVTMVREAMEAFPTLPDVGRKLQSATDALALANAAYTYARTRYREALQAYSKALEELARATLILNDCEARFCPAPSAGSTPLDAIRTLPSGTIRPRAPVPAPPGLTLSKRPAACVACAEFAVRRDELAELVNQGEAQMQRLRNELADNARSKANAETSLRSASARLRSALESQRQTEALGAPSDGALIGELRAWELTMRNNVRHYWEEEGLLTVELKAEGARQDQRYNRFLDADRQLLECERLMCVRPQVDAAPVASPAPVQTATPPGGQAAPPRTPAPAPQTTPPPPAPTPGDKRTSRAEVQIFGGFAFQSTGLSQTGADTFGGAPLIDTRASDAARRVLPMVGAFGRVYPFKADSGDAAPAPRVFFTAGVLVTPGSTRGFEAAGINTVPLGEVRTEYSRTFVAPVMVGVRLPFAMGSTPVNFDLMGGIAIGHETVRATLLREGGAAGSRASGESSGFFVDPIFGLGLSTTVAVIDGLGPVSVGAMGLAMIGTGGRSVRLQSPGFASQTYTGESRRNVTFYGGVTVTLGLF